MKNISFMRNGKEFEPTKNELRQVLDDYAGKLEITQKALKLACERIKYFEEMQDNEMGFIEMFGYTSQYDLQAIIDSYMKQAKEMIKSDL